MSTWRKASYCWHTDHCAEVGAWRTSSRSGFTGNCAEVGSGAAVVGVRDTKLGEYSPLLTFSPDAWREFTGRVKADG